MGLFKRAADIVRANLNELLESAEDPEKMINLYLEDAREHLQEARNAVHTALSAEKSLQMQWDDANNDVQVWQKRAELAVSRANDGLAKEALEKKKAAERRRGSLDTPTSQTKAQANKARHDLQLLEERIQEAETNRTVLIARAQAAKAMKSTADAVAGISSHDPLRAMGSMEEKIQRMEAEAAASAEMIDAGVSSSERDFREMESGSSIDDELAALKRKMTAKSVL